MMVVEYETDNYEWCYDSAYGVGRFIRKSDNAVTYLETGSDCDTIRNALSRLATNRPGRNPNCFDAKGREIFDSMAQEYTFHDGYVPLASNMPQE